MAQGDSPDAEQIERLFLRLATIDDESKLADFIAKHLLRIFGYLQRPQPNTRQQCSELLNHLTKRIRTNPGIQLPFDAILAEYTKPECSISTVISIYLRISFERLPTDRQISAVSELLPVLVSKSAAEQNEIAYRLLFLCVKTISLQPEHSAPVKFAESELVFDYLLDLLLLPSTNFDESSDVPPGLSMAGMSRLKNWRKFDNFDQVKCGILRLLGSTVVDTGKILPHLIVALSDSNHLVSSKADTLLRKLDVAECFEKEAVILAVFGLYLGTLKSKTIAEVQKRQPLRLRQKLKLFPFFLKSNTAAKTFPNTVQVLFDALFGEDALSGTAGLKLQFMAAEWLPTVSASCASSNNMTYGTIVFQGAKNLAAKATDARLVALAYIALGRVGAHSCALLLRDLAFVQQVFEELATTNDDVCAAVSDCLLLWLPVFVKNSSPNERTILQSLVSKTLSENSSTRSQLLALKYAEEVFDAADVPSRWQLLCACANKQESVQREARKILYTLSTVKLPDFGQTVSFVQNKLFESDFKDSPMQTAVLQEAVAYLHAVLRHAAGYSGDVEVDSDEYWKQVPKICTYLSENIEVNCANAYARLIYAHCCVSVTLNLLYMMAELCFARGDFLTCLPSDFVDTYQTAALSTTNHSVAAIAAELCVHLTVASENESAAKELLVKCETELDSTDASVGSVWLTGHLLSRLPAISLASLEHRLVKFVSVDRPNSVCEAACCAVSLILRVRQLHVFAENLSSQSELLDKLLAIAKSTREVVKVKLKESALRCIGYLITETVDEQLRNKATEGLLEIADGPPQLDLQFFVGEALVGCALGSENPERRNRWTETSSDFVSKFTAVRQSSQNLEALIGEIVTKRLQSPNRHVRQAAIIWLSVITEKCIWHPTVGEHSEALQSAFVDGLTEANEFTQSIASKALGIIYEGGQENMKERLLGDLVATLTGERRVDRPVTGDTKVFQKGVIGKTPDGESLSTYRELCSLATDMNKPDLIYEFMKLANHQAMWNSKKGAAVGFEAVLTTAKEHLEPLLPVLVPKIYRYRYDPDLKVQSAMKSIWQALAGGRKGVLDEFSMPILRELIPSLTDKLWRVRESSCLALSDLLSGHYSAEMTGEFPRLWETLFRLQDDIKESVRIAANRAILTLKKVTVKLCSGGKSPKLAEQLLPSIIDGATRGATKEVKIICLATILELVKEAGAAVRPRLGDLVVALLESISESEHALVNYLAVRADDDQMEALDSARAAAARGSPAMDALSDCAHLVDSAETLAAVSAPCAELLRGGGVGLPTRTAAAAFVSQLCAHCKLQLMQSPQQADKLFRALSDGLRDRNVTIRKQSASAMGQLAKFCSTSAIDKLLQKLTKEFIENQGRDVALRHFLLSLARNNQETLVDMGQTVAAVVFFAIQIQGMPEEKEKMEAQRKEWEEIWSEIAHGSEAGVRLYYTELFNFCELQMTENPAWTLKSTAARALSKVVEFSSILESDKLAAVINLGLKCLSGRVWDGKEDILKLLNDVFDKYGASINGVFDEFQLNECFNTLLVLCQKRSLPYKLQALETAGSFCESTNFDGFTGLAEILLPLLKFEQTLYGSDDDETDTVTDKSANLAKQTDRVNFEISAVTCLSAAFTQHTAAATETSNAFVETLQKLLSTSYWKTKLSIVGAFDKILQLSDERPTILTALNPDQLITDLVDTIETAPQSSLVDAALNLMEKVLASIESGQLTLTEPSTTKQQLLPLRSHELCLARASITDLLSRVIARL